MSSRLIIERRMRDGILRVRQNAPANASLARGLFFLKCPEYARRILANAECLDGRQADWRVFSPTCHGFTPELVRFHDGCLNNGKRFALVVRQRG